MASRVIDYFFKSDPFDFNFRLLVLNGFWPLKTKSKCVQVLYSIYSFLCCFSPLSMLFIQILDVYLLLGDPYTLTKNICATSMTFASMTKYLLVFYKADKLHALHRKLKEFKRYRSDPRDLDILAKASTFMSRTTKSLYSLGIPCITAWMLYPALESADQKGLPFPYRLPTDDWSTPIYEILYTYQSLSMVGFMVIILSNDLLYYSMVIQINAEYDILIKEVEDIGTVINDDEGVPEGVTPEEQDRMVAQRVKLTLKECVASHQRILEQIRQLKAIYAIPCLIHFLCVVLLMGLIIIDVVVISKGFKLQMLQRIMYSLNGVFDTFLLCYFTTWFEEKSHKLNRTIYSCNWHRLGVGVRKDLLMMLMITKRAPTIKIGYHFPLNLETFLQFLKLSYNITALLYQTVRR